MTGTTARDEIPPAGLPELQRTPLDTKPIPAFANGLVREIETTARLAMEDPVKAVAAGITPMKDAPLLEDVGGPPSHADWLRGAVVALLPPGWRYMIAQSMDGTASLVLTGYVDA
jgi:hypothetical protein